MLLLRPVQLAAKDGATVAGIARSRMQRTHLGYMQMWMLRIDMAPIWLLSSETIQGEMRSNSGPPYIEMAVEKTMTLFWLQTNYTSVW